MKHKTPRRILGLIVAGLVLLAAGAHPVSAQDDQATDGEGGQIAVETNLGTDRAIALRLLGIYAEIDGLENVDVMANDGVVTLEGRVPTADLAETAEGLAKRIEGVVVVKNAIQEDQEIANRLGSVYDRFMERLDDFIAFLPMLGLGLIIIAVFWLLGSIAAARRGLVARLTANPFIAHLWRQAIFVAFLLAGGLIAADVMGATAILGSLLGAAGLVGLAIGFAVKDTIENVIATILLSVRQPFSALDYVDIEGVEGTVARMSSRATTLISMDGNHVRIPNATVFKAVITNYTRNPERRLTFNVGVDPDSDLKQAIEVAHETLAGMPDILNEPAPVAVIDELGDFAVTISVTGWINQHHTDFFKARSEAIRRVKEAYDAAGIAMPVPTYTVQERQAGATGTTQHDTAIPTPERRPTGGQVPTSDEVLDTSADTTVADKAKAERDAIDSDDLLSEDAEQE